jgi:hypothetical protein
MRMSKQGAAARAFLFTVAASAKLPPCSASAFLWGKGGGDSRSESPARPQAKLLSVSQEAFCVQLSPPVGRLENRARSWLTRHSRGGALGAARGGAARGNSDDDARAQPPLPGFGADREFWAPAWSSMSLKGGSAAPRGGRGRGGVVRGRGGRGGRGGAGGRGGRGEEEEVKPAVLLDPEGDLVDFAQVVGQLRQSGLGPGGIDARLGRFAAEEAPHVVSSEGPPPTPEGYSDSEMFSGALRRGSAVQVCALTAPPRALHAQLRRTRPGRRGSLRAPRCPGAG